MLKLKLQYFGHLIQGTDSLEKTLKEWRQKEKGMTEDEMVGWHQWTWVWASSVSWWWTGNPGMLQSMGLQRVGHTERLNWTQLNQCRRCRSGFEPRVRKIPCRRVWQLTPVFLPRESNGQSNLAGYSLDGAEFDTIEHSHTHKKIPWHFTVYKTLSNFLTQMIHTAPMEWGVSLSPERWSDYSKALKLVSGEAREREKPVSDTSHQSYLNVSTSVCSSGDHPLLLNTHFFLHSGGNTC